MEKSSFWDWLNNSPSVQIFLVFLIIFFGGIAFYLKKDPCQEVMTYYINYIDDSFTNSKIELIEAARQAEFVWEVETLSEIFKYEEGGDLQINFSPKKGNENQAEFDKGYHEKGIIVIHQYYNLNDLSLVLAHEFGHALGIKDHVDDSTAVMHHNLNNVSSNNIKLKPDDIAAVKKICDVF